MTDTLTFYVAGDPQTKGSTRSYYIKKADRVVTMSANKNLKSWEARVAYTAQQAANQMGWTPEPWPAFYKMSMHFFLKRPGAPRYVIRPAKKPDIDKLARAVLDGVDGILYTDDAQVVLIAAEKHFHDPSAQVYKSPGVQVNIQKERMTR